MKRLLIAIITFFLFSSTSHAAHIKGGFFTYQYLGPGSGTNLRYHITLTVYMICNPSPGQLSNPINFSIFNAGTNQFIQDVSVSITNQYNLSKLYDDPCITDNQAVCYYTIVVYDLPSIELPSIPQGYTIAYQRCCRIAGINNVVNSGTVGNTFTITIPGTAAPLNAFSNSSPQFLINDTAVICAGHYFQYSFQASDPDGDSLSYQFCDAYTGGSIPDAAPVTAANPPYSFIPYQAPFTGTQPMGAGVTINPVTGLISGIAPDISGEYVICVCVSEYRNGILIATTRKELHIHAGDCLPIAATLDPQYLTCNGFNWTFSNGGDQSLISSYNWFFGDPGSGPNDSSNLQSPTHVFSDTGAFVVTLIVNRGQECTDTGKTIMKVYPGFFPGFTVAGSCFTNPFQFTDTTRTNYGIVNSWSWNFGDASTLADTAHIWNPVWTYPASGPKDITLIVTNSKGCIDTALVTINVLDKPQIILAFNDSLICKPDAVTLNAEGSGVFNWTPLTSIINPNTATPTVNPTVSTWYIVNLNDNGCLNKDSVHVRVVNGVNILARADTTICLTDAVQLDAITNGLQFQWTPATTLNDPTIRNPIATPLAASTTYQVKATIGTCFATDNVTINTVPYPLANAGPDKTICYNTSVQLNGVQNGNSFSWSPASYLDNPNILNPVSSPPRTTTYIFSVFDNKGCPKPGRDTVVITVNPKIRAFAGHDTTVVVGQPLHFNGTGGVNYLWSPSTGLSSTTIFNPIGIYGPETDSVRYKLVVSDLIGCADSAYITVRVFKTNPSVFVPTAFTPNNDGLNDVIRPITVGIQKINYFSIYNRWGQLVFTTTEIGKGWDGRIHGTAQPSSVFVWMVSAVDYLGKSIFEKGTVTLIR